MRLTRSLGAIAEIKAKPGENGRASRMSDHDFRSELELGQESRDGAGHSWQGKVRRFFGGGETMAGQIGRENLKAPRQQWFERLKGVR